MSQTLHADASGTITISNLTGQDALTQESIREIEESLNQQLFSATDLTLDKEQVILFDQNFGNCVFPNITLQGESLELSQVLNNGNLAAILPSEKDPNLFSCEQCGAQCKTESDLKNHQFSHLQNHRSVNCRTIKIGNKTIILEEDTAADNLTRIEEESEVDLRCDVCNVFVCSNEEDLRSHRETHLSCDICDKLFPTTAQYRAHVKSHGREKEFVCNYCGSSFSQLSSLVRHLAIHNSNNKLVSCSVCSQSFRTEAQLRRHTTEYHEERKLRRRRAEVHQLTEEEASQLVSQEPTCMSERVLKAALAEKDRISDLKDPKSFKQTLTHPNQCGRCPKSFRKPSDLVRHLRTHTGERPYQCDFCSKCFTVKSTLDTHLKTHNTVKRCVCHMCGFYFATKGSLKVHMRLHTGSLPFRCLVCSQRFRTSGHRKAHLLTHVRENQAQLKKNSLIPKSELAPTAPTDNNTAEDIPTENTAVTLENMHLGSQYHCTVCNKLFTKNSYLVRHMKTHTGEKPFSCKICEKSFSQKTSLSIHMKIHSGEKEWICTQCVEPKRFRQKGNLTAHVKRFHFQPFIDLSLEKFPVDLEKVVSEMFPHMKPNKSLTSQDDEI